MNRLAETLDTSVYYSPTHWEYTFKFFFFFLVSFSHNLNIVMHYVIYFHITHVGFLHGYMFSVFMNVTFYVLSRKKCI